MSCDYPMDPKIVTTLHQPEVYCTILTALFVGSFYVLKTNLPRDHPVTIKKRFKAVGCVCLLSVALWWFLIDSYSAREKSKLILELFGVTTTFSLWHIKPILHCVVLFAGLIAVHILHGTSPFQEGPRAFTLMFWRNYFVGPFAEEWVFRCAMVPFARLSGWSTMRTILTLPVFFASAHIHHFFAMVRTLTQLGRPNAVRIALINTLVQFTYTYLFGIYVTHVFWLYNSLWSPLICHAICNLMSLPDLKALNELEHSKKRFGTIMYAAGILGFIGGYFI